MPEFLALNTTGIFITKYLKYFGKFGDKHNFLHFNHFLKLWMFCQFGVMFSMWSTKNRCTAASCLKLNKKGRIKKLNMSTAQF